MAITLSSSGQATNGTSPSISVTVGSSDTLLVAFAYLTNTGGGFTEATFNGTTLSPAGLGGQGTGFGFGTCQMYSLVNPVVGTSTLAWTPGGTSPSGQANLVYMVFSGTNTVTGIHDGQSSGQVVPPPQSTVTCAWNSGEYTVGVLQDSSGGTQAITGGTVLFNASFTASDSRVYKWQFGYVTSSGVFTSTNSGSPFRSACAAITTKLPASTNGNFLQFI